MLWAEERGLRSVAQRLLECSASAVRRPVLSLFRGYFIQMAERTVALANSFVTVCARRSGARWGKSYYEFEILDRDHQCPQYGFAAPDEDTFFIHSTLELK